MDASALISRMAPSTMAAPSMTAYRVNLHSPRKPSPLNPASQKLAKVDTAGERQCRGSDGDAQREGSRRSRTVSPTQKTLRRRAAKTLQTNALRRQVEAYEAKALQGLAAKSAAPTNPPKKAKGKDPLEPTYKIGIAAATGTSHQPSRKKRRRRWGALWMFFRTRPVVAVLGNIWPFESTQTQELAWHPTEHLSPAAAASAA